MMRIGHGYDVHQLQAGLPLTLGGIIIPHSAGLVGHSDADVVLHAICDAVLGALGLGDIGRHFPDSDPDNENRDSREFLRFAIDRMRAAQFQLGNLDVTIVAQAPKLAPFIGPMCGVIADDFGSAHNRVNIKATTTENLGFVGRKEGIAAHAVVLLEKN
ncbi:MAG: 2-C-methyl-D-erythritol 2,4-cyclodiphosphate synthase [Gammaproteobacteria bacterium]|nr:2-C-methyl-D-erythritol 2,4-cyclodiphosphate synthase [Gammaproteobacteria bacterium]